jgi:multisubunit Na+/H+ antiporter MnhB subunit
MSWGFAFDIALALLVLGLAGWTLALSSNFAAVVDFVVYGLALTLVWVRLAAPDVALTEAAIGTGLTGALLLGAAARLRVTEAAAAAERPGPGVRALAALLAAIVAGGLAAAVLYLPDPGPTLAPQALADLPATGVGNAVTGVLMAYRAADTLLEKVVVLISLIAVWSLADGRFWGGRPGQRQQADPDGPLAFLARRLPPLGIVAGVYLVWMGADMPGGAFPGSTIIAAMWLLAIMAGATDTPPISGRGVRLALTVGPAVFLAVGFAGIFIAGAFLAYPVAYAKALIVFIEVGMVLTIAVSLGLLMSGPPERSERL